MKFTGVVTLRQDLLVYKKAYLNGRTIECIVKLLLHSGTRINVTSGKCRAERALVLGFETKMGTPIDNYAVVNSSHDSQFIYKYLATVTPHHFDSSDNICSGGIHFFRTKREAQRYQWT